MLLDRHAVTSATVALLVATTALQAQAPRRTGPTPCAGKPSADTTVYPPEALDNLPVVRKFASPHYSFVPQLGTELRVRVSFVVNKDGTVDPASVKLVDSTGTVFDHEAEHWIGTFLFWPGCYEGQAVRARVTKPVSYAQVPYAGPPGP